jgi:hypothetical protein
MNRRDKVDVIDAIVTYTQPVLAEIRAYRAEASAWRAEAQAHRERLELKFAEHERDIEAIMKRLFPDEDAGA